MSEVDTRVMLPTQVPEDEELIDKVQLERLKMLMEEDFDKDKMKLLSDIAGTAQRSQTIVSETKTADSQRELADAMFATLNRPGTGNPFKTEVDSGTVIEGEVLEVTLEDDDDFGELTLVEGELSTEQSTIKYDDVFDDEID